MIGADTMTNPFTSGEFRVDQYNEYPLVFLILALNLRFKYEAFPYTGFTVLLY